MIAPNYKEDWDDYRRRLQQHADAVIEAERVAFEFRSGDFSLERREFAPGMPGDDYAHGDTSQRWMGWLAAKGLA